MSLKLRLSTLKQQSGASVETEVSNHTTTVSDRIDRCRTRQVNAVQNGNEQIYEELARLLNGEFVAPGVVKIESRISLEGSHGCVPLEGLKGSMLPFPGKPDVNIQKCLF